MRDNHPQTPILNSWSLATATLLLSVISAIAIPLGEVAAIPNPKLESQNRLAQAQPREDRRAEAIQLNREGLQLLNRGQFRDALEKVQKSLILFRELADRNSEGTLLNNLGEVYRNLGQYPRAIEYYQQALAIHKEVGNRAGVGRTLNNLGAVYSDLGQYPAAIEYYQQALAIHKEVGNRAGVGRTLNNLGAVYHNLGQYPAAIEYYQQALAIRLEVGDRPMEGTTLNNLGLVYDDLGQYQEAIEYYQQALTIYQEVGNKTGEGTILITLGWVYNNRGLAYHNRGQYAEAIEYYQQALAIHREVGDRPMEGTTLNNLGLVYDSLGQYQKAIEYYQQALAIRQEVGDRAGEGITLNNLGLAYNNLGQYPQAIEYYQQALAIHKEVGIGNHAEEGDTLHNLGAVYNELGQYSKAIEYYQQALAIAQEVGDRAGEGSTLSYLGRVYHNQKQYTEAEKNLYASITVQESLRSSELADADKISLFDTQAFTYRWLQHTLIAQNKTDRALEISERGRARAFVELLAKQLNPLSEEPSKIDPPSVEEIQQIAKAQNATLVQYSVLGNSTLLIWVIQPTGKIDFRAVDLQKLDGSLADITEIARLEAANERSADNPDEFTALIRGTQESLRDIVALPLDAENPLSRLKQLHQVLIAPIADLLPTNPEDRVIFIPHQSLFYVPFPALTDENDNYLIEQHTILTAPSIQVLQLTREHRQRVGTNSVGTLNLTSLRGNNAVIVGNPVMPWIPDKDGKLFQLSNLSGAEREAIEIAEMLDTEPLLGARATETVVSQRMKTARLIHFATHGLLQDLGYGIPGAIALAPSSVSPFSRGTEGGSALILSDSDDGLLTSGEIVTMTQNNPLNAELVVLSACETGLGDLSGDGMIGLSRSLITAGVPSIVVSLWKVPDDATRALMTEFYTNHYQKEMDKAQALRQAMLTMLRGENPDPRDWAAFTLIGEAQ